MQQEIIKSLFDYFKHEIRIKIYKNRFWSHSKNTAFSLAGT